MFKIRFGGLIFNGFLTLEEIINANFQPKIRTIQEEYEDTITTAGLYHVIMYSFNIFSAHRNKGFEQHKMVYLQRRVWLRGE
jgi:hypothetical protein